MKEQVLILQIPLDFHLKTTLLETPELTKALDEGWQIKHIQFNITAIDVKDKHSHLVVSTHLQKTE